MDGVRVSNPTSRRTLLKAGLALAGASTLLRPVSARAAAAYYKAVFDERFEEARAFAAGAAERQIATAAIRRDITKLFFDDLDLRWKTGPVVLAGYTTSASLFCLDLLARDRGMRVSHCATQASVGRALGVLDGAVPQSRGATGLPASDPSPLVFWILAPRARR